MTETEPEAMDLFMRQGILSGRKVPLLWVSQDNGRFFKTGIFSYLGQECDADVAVYGTGRRGAPLMTSADQAKGIAWAAQVRKIVRSANNSLDVVGALVCRASAFSALYDLTLSRCHVFVSKVPQV
jgi:hypothetical protein